MTDASHKHALRAHLAREMNTGALCTYVRRTDGDGTRYAFICTNGTRGAMRTASYMREAVIYWARIARASVRATGIDDISARMNACFWAGALARVRGAR